MVSPWVQYDMVREGRLEQLAPASLILLPRSERGPVITERGDTVVRTVAAGVVRYVGTSAEGGNKEQCLVRCVAESGSRGSWTGFSSASFGRWLKFLQFRRWNIGLFIRAGRQPGAYVCAAGRHCARIKRAQPFRVIEDAARPVHAWSTSIYPAGPNGPGSMRFIAPERVEPAGERDYLSSGSWP